MLSFANLPDFPIFLDNAKIWVGVLSVVPATVMSGEVNLRHPGSGRGQFKNNDCR
jgi:hypothetical protein